ncbi:MULTISPECIES: helix-turn-helix transcriptional regulator [unclassified Kitasatospora]|uniref:helix-turn-helix domain-containing protein n=1 Tax=unclassified Kitasatospora TaxID=2633591 RepID=UPI003830790D
MGRARTVKPSGATGGWRPCGAGSRPPVDPGPPAALTVREREVLRPAAEGHPDGEIAALLHLAESTVNTHVKRVLGKLGARATARRRWPSRTGTA